MTLSKHDPTKASTQQTTDFFLTPMWQHLLHKPNGLCSAIHSITSRIYPKTVNLGSAIDAEQPNFMWSLAILYEEDLRGFIKVVHRWTHRSNQNLTKSVIITNIY